LCSSCLFTFWPPGIYYWTFLPSGMQQFLNHSLWLMACFILVHSHTTVTVTFLRLKYQVRSFIQAFHPFWRRSNFLSLQHFILVLPTSPDSSPGTQSVNNSWSSITFMPGVVPDTTHFTLYSPDWLNHTQPLLELRSLCFLCLFTLFFPCKTFFLLLLHLAK
jgi:hypothetical protein